MDKIITGFKLTRADYFKRGQELKLDNNWYFRCKECREIMHEKLTEKHKCQLYDEEEKEESKNEMN